MKQKEIAFYLALYFAATVIAHCGSFILVNFSHLDPVGKVRIDYASSSDC